MATRVLDWQREISVPSQVVALIMGLVAVGMVMLGMPQMITGVIVNMILILCTEKCGLEKAVILGMVTPIVAAFSGILPVALLLMIPFITIGNAIYVSIYSMLSERNRATAVITGAFLKFIFLFAAVSLIMTRPIMLVIGSRPQSVPIPAAIVGMMSYPQLFTALVGGLLAVSILEVAKRLTSGQTKK